jgi:uncharacterized protein
MTERYENNTQLLADPELYTDIVQPEVEAAILKIHRDCNIRCYPTDPEEPDTTQPVLLPMVPEQAGTECYMYKHDTDRSQPKIMSMQVIDAVAQRLGEDAHKRQSPQKIVIFHGGEPLLAPPEFFDEATERLKRYLPEDTALLTKIETNATRLNDAYLKVFKKHNTRVGISLDGDRDGNSGRVYANGRETFDGVMEAVERINQPYYRHLFAGFLAVMNTDADPLKTYDFFRDMLVPDGMPRADRRNPTIDFLPPLGGHGADYPYENDAHRASKPYAHWIAPITRRWLEQDTSLFNLRLAQGIIDKMRGRPGSLDALGNDMRNQIVVKTNGVCQLTDTLLYAGHGITDLAVSVRSHTFEQISEAATRRLQQLGALTLPTVCAEVCPKQTSSVCGGGNIPNRFKDGKFDQPSSLCGDLSMMIADIRGSAVALSEDARHDTALAAYFQYLNIATS